MPDDGEYRIDSYGEYRIDSYGEYRIDSYYCHVETETLAIPNPRDILRCNVTVSLQHCANSSWHRDIMEVSKLLESSISINLESFLENNQDFLTIFLSDRRCSHYFIPESLDPISQCIVSMTQELLLELPSDDPEYANSECQEFPLTLEIVVALQEDEEIEREVIEESMQQGVAMMPASNEAIHSLKTFTESLFLKTEKCSICIEKFCTKESDENVKFSLSSMPCGHVFHHQCIVKWLKISHVCPMCRYPMPTLKD